MKKLIAVFLVFAYFLDVHAQGPWQQLPDKTEADEGADLIVNLAYLELCDDEAHIHISIADKNIENATEVRITTDWDRSTTSLQSVPIL